MTAPIVAEEFLPGTRRLFDEHGNNLPGDEGLVKHGDIILVPQPTESPNDPLNWSLPRKIWHSVLVCFVVALTAATSNDAGSASDGINTQFGISYNYFNTGAGVLFIGIGYWTLLSAPAVHLYGRRILYLVGMVWGFIGNLWYGRVRTINDVIWAQLFVGASESVAEAVVQLSLLDIWFEHQNGTSLGMYTLATSVGTYLGPLIASYIADSSLGWPWIGYFGAIFSAMTFMLFYFGLEETAFRRDRSVQSQGSSWLMDGVKVSEKTAEHAITTDGSHSSGTEDKPVLGDMVPTSEKLNDEGSPSPAPSDIERNRLTEQPRSYFSRIPLITPAMNLKGLGFRQYMSRLWHMMRIFTFPAVWFAGLQWGMQNVCLTFYLTVEEDNWYGPPWNYDVVQDGNMNLPCLIGSVIGCFYGGYCSDRFLIWMTKRNGGIMEAEYRLYLMALCVAIFPTGMWLFGVGSAQGWSWPVPYVGLGFIGFGYGCAGDLSITYLADSYPDMVLEGMVGVAVINNTLAMIFTFVASYWIASDLQNCFIELGAISFVVMALALPMILFGKQARRYTRQKYFNFLELRDGLEA